MIVLGPQQDETAAASRRSPGELWNLLSRCAALVWRAGRTQVIVIVVAQCVGAAGLAIQLVVVRGLVTQIAGGPSRPFQGLLMPLLLLVVINTVSGVAAFVESQQRTLLGELAERAAAQPLMEVAAGVRLAEFERAEFQDFMRRAQLAALHKPVAVVTGMINIGNSLLALTGLAIGLCLIAPILLPVVIVTVVPLSMASIAWSRAYYRFSREMTPEDRKRYHMLGLLTTRLYAKEVRSFDLGAWVRAGYDRLASERLRRLATYISGQQLPGLAGTLASSMIFATTVATLALATARGYIELPSAIAAMTATIQMRGQLQSFISAFTQIYESSLFLGDFDGLMKILGRLRSEDVDGGARPRTWRHVEMRNVTFEYAGPGEASPAQGSREGCHPRGGQRALEGVSIRVSRGEIVAVVGENGSGKTTLLKILCGLYPPTTGEVLVDGARIAEVSRDWWRGQVGVLFQDFAHYMMSVRENVGLGRVEAIDDIGRIRCAADEAGVSSLVGSWPDGYETMLGSVFAGGREPSIGQWQKLALARGFFRQGGLLLLDEPASALDPRAEHQLFERLRSSYRHAAVLMISHRFSGVRRADRIYVLQRGALIEHGSHDDLMRRDGLYAELFRLQTGPGESATAATSEHTC
jgi:ATP-binding cassette subfamily B protein